MKKFTLTLILLITFSVFIYASEAVKTVEIPSSEYLSYNFDSIARGKYGSDFPDIKITRKKIHLKENYLTRSIYKYTITNNDKVSVSVKPISNKHVITSDTCNKMIKKNIKKDKNSQYREALRTVTQYPEDVAMTAGLTTASILSPFPFIILWYNESTNPLSKLKRDIFHPFNKIKSASDNYKKIEPKKEATDELIKSVKQNIDENIINKQTVLNPEESINFGIAFNDTNLKHDYDEFELGFSIIKKNCSTEYIIYR